MSHYGMSWLHHVNQIYKLKRGNIGQDFNFINCLNCDSEGVIAVPSTSHYSAKEKEFSFFLKTWFLQRSQKSLAPPKLQR